MSFRMYKCAYRFLIISLLCFTCGCSSLASSVTISSTRVDPEGTKEEQIAYHQAEIKKYQVAVSKENANATRYLNQYQMNDVRQSNSRKQQYQKKIEEHTQAIRELEQEP